MSELGIKFNNMGMYLNTEKNHVFFLNLIKLKQHIKNKHSVTAIDVLSNGVIPMLSLVMLPVRREVLLPVRREVFE